MKLQKINQSFYLCLPKSIVLAKQWKQGDELEYKITDKGNLLIGKKN